MDKETDTKETETTPDSDNDIITLNIILPTSSSNKPSESTPKTQKLEIQSHSNHLSAKLFQNLKARPVTKNGPSIPIISTKNTQTGSRLQIIQTPIIV